MNGLYKQKVLRNHCDQASAILKLEGWTPNKKQLERQERYIRGEATIDELLQEVFAEGLAAKA